MTQRRVAECWEELPTEVQILLNLAVIWNDAQRRLVELRELDFKSIRRQGGSVDKMIDAARDADDHLRDALREVDKLRRRWNQCEVRS